MEILREWFLPGESDLLGAAILLIAFAALAPWEKTRQWSGWFIVGCVLIYGGCEALAAFWGQSYGVAFFALFLGGGALCLAIGSLLRKGVLALWKRRG